MNSEVPTVEIHGACWSAFLLLLHRWGESGVANYLQRNHLLPLSAADLGSHWNLPRHPTVQATDVFLVQPCWVGVCGTFASSGSGSQAVEAFHSPWKKELEQLGGDAHLPRALERLQVMFTEWADSLSLRSQEPLFNVPRARDAKVVSGHDLHRFDCSPATDFARRPHTHKVLWENEAGAVLVLQRRASQEGTNLDEFAPAAAFFVGDTPPHVALNLLALWTQRSS